MEISEISIRRNGRTLTAAMARAHGTVAGTPAARAPQHWAIKIQEDGHTINLDGPETSKEDTEQSIIRMLEAASVEHPPQP